MWHRAGSAGTGLLEASMWWRPNCGHSGTSERSDVPNTHFNFDTCLRAGVCGSVGVWMRGRRGGGAGREGGRDRGEEPRRSSSAHTCHPRLAGEMLGWHGSWTLDALPPRPRRLSGRRSKSYPAARRVNPAAGSYTLGFLPGLSLEKTCFRIMNGSELDIFKVEGL